MQDSRADRASERRQGGFLGEESSYADRGAPRTLDEEQALIGPGTNHQPVLNSEESAGPERRKGYWEGKPASPASQAGDRGCHEAGTNVVSSPVLNYHSNLPPESLFTLGELALSVVAASAAFFALRWALVELAVVILLPQVAAHTSLIAFAVGLGVGTSLWSARRTKRLNKAKHLRGELPT